MSSKEPLFSFVLPAYKAQFLREAIESILNQTYQNFELVIVDDASPEDLKSIVNTFSDTRLKYYRNDQNIGGSDLVKQWNHCLTFAQGDYVILAADDDVYNKDFLSEAVALFSKYPEIPLFRGRVQGITADGIVNDMDCKGAEYLSFGDFLLFERKIIACLGNYIFRSTDIKRTGFLDYPLAWWSDRATVIEHATAGILISEKVVFSFRDSPIHISANVSTPSLEKKIEATYQYFVWLKEKLKSTSDDSAEFKFACDIYMRNNHWYFHYLSGLILMLPIKDLFPLLNKIKRQKMISPWEYKKLIFFYFNNFLMGKLRGKYAI